MPSNEYRYDEQDEPYAAQAPGLQRGSYAMAPLIRHGGEGAGKAQRTEEHEHRQADDSAGQPQGHVEAKRGEGWPRAQPFSRCLHEAQRNDDGGGGAI